MVVFGILQILFRGPFSRFDMRLYEWIHRRVPAVYAILGMRHRLDAHLQVATTVMFGVFFRHSRSGCRGLGVVSVNLAQHPDEHCPERPVLLAVDQELCEGTTLRVAPELADPIGALEVGEHEDVEQLGARSRTEGVQALAEAAFEFIGTHQV
jgi:hypothetical protein